MEQTPRSVREGKGCCKRQSRDFCGQGHIPCHPVPLWGQQVDKTQVKLSLGKKEPKEGIFKILFHFSLSFSDLTGKKLNLFTQVETTLPVTVIVD